MPHDVSEEAGAARRGRILLVEDNEAANKGLARLLEASGFEVTTVLDGESALRALATSPPPDILLTDMQLPDLDGRELALRARQLEPPPRIVLITGWDLEPLPSLRAAWGIDWVLTKPLDMSTLLDTLSRPPPADRGS
jgi:DNA-binding response OmpR family regulator